MKKDAKQFIVWMRTNVYDSLKRQSTIRNQSMAKYIETLITKREKFSPSVIKAINDIQHIIDRNITNYKALNSALSNLNQLTYSLHINELPTKDEILNTIQIAQKNIAENRNTIQSIIKTLKPFTTPTKKE